MTQNIVWWVLPFTLLASLVSAQHAKPPKRADNVWILEKQE